MAWTATTWRARFTEFGEASDTLVDAALAEAAAECNATIFGSTYDHAVGLLAAHKLALGQRGLPARQEGNDKAKTTYLEEWRNLARKRAGGAWSIGQGPSGLLT